MSEFRDELDPPFEILEPAARRGPVLFNSPHSGSTYPRDFLARRGSISRPCAARKTALSTT